MSGHIDQEKLSPSPATPSSQSQSKTLKKSPKTDLNQCEPASSASSSLRRSAGLESRVSATDDDDDHGGSKRKNGDEEIDKGSSGSGSFKGRKRKTRASSGSRSKGESGSGGVEDDEKKSDVGGTGNAEVSKVDSDDEEGCECGDVREKGNSRFTRLVKMKDHDSCSVQLKDGCKEIDEKESTDTTVNGSGNGVDEDIKGDDSSEAARENDLASGKRRYSREEQGKGALAEESEPLIGVDRLDLNSSPVDEDTEIVVAGLLSMAQKVIEDEQKKNAIEMARNKANNMRCMREKFHEAARERAESFALGLDRKRTAQQNKFTFDTYKPTIKIEWRPSNDRRRICLVPSLLDLSMSALAKYAEFISSLGGVPDLLRHRLSHLLCESRRMDDRFMKLLVSGLPTEVCLKDCSWMTEEQMNKIFHGCNFNQLSVLQLDYCGRCLPDYVVRNTLAKSKNCMPSLLSISLRGACRLTDNGLIALISSAPQLGSINLGQCSLLTSSGIHNMVISLGSSVRELYLDDCQNIDVMLILPALMELQHLEVLSLTGINTVCDDFVEKLLSVCGPTIKELLLANCSDLTDYAVGAIAAARCGLRSLDICNVNKLTDVAIGHLIYGCRSMQVLKLGSNSFSDEAIAAFLEASGESLVELSLNKLKKVGPNTAISIPRRLRNLQILDMSWCRNLTDDAVGLIVDNCMSLRLLKLFGCTQITSRFVNGHSNPSVHIVGLKMTPVLEHLSIVDRHFVPLLYTAVSSCTES